MRTNIEIDDRLIKEVMEILEVKTKKEAVELALKEVLRKKANLEMSRLRGSGWGWDEAPKD